MGRERDPFTHMETRNNISWFDLEVVPFEVNLLATENRISMLNNRMDTNAYIFMIFSVEIIIFVFIDQTNKRISKLQGDTKYKHIFLKTYLMSKWIHSH